MTDPDERLSQLEQKVESALALDARLKGIEDSVKKLNPRSTVKDWIQTVSPFVTAIAVFIVGYVLKDSVSMAMQRETLDLSYVTNVRDLIKGFDTATEQTSADSNAIALAMYGRFAIVPLLERLQGGGDVAQLAAERGLLLVGSNEPKAACKAFTQVLRDPAPRYPWQTHKAVIRLIGMSGCVPSMQALDANLAELQTLGDPKRLAAFARRFSNPDAFDVENVESLKSQILEATALLKVSRDRAGSGEPAWWQ